MVVYNTIIIVVFNSSIILIFAIHKWSLSFVQITSVIRPKRESSTNSYFKVNYNIVNSLASQLLQLYIHINACHVNWTSVGD